MQKTSSADLFQRCRITALTRLLAFCPRKESTDTRCEIPLGREPKRLLDPSDIRYAVTNIALAKYSIYRHVRRAAEVVCDRPNNFKDRNPLSRAYIQRSAGRIWSTQCP